VYFSPPKTADTTRDRGSAVPSQDDRSGYNPSTNAAEAAPATSNSALASRFNQMFPVLSPAEIDRVRRFGEVRRFPAGDLLFLDSVGQLLRLTPDHTLRLLARLPSGHYQRTHMTVGPDGSVFVSSGFHIRQVFRVSPEGGVSVVARHLGDPEGIAVSEAGDVFVAENALHRVIRIRPSLRPPPPSPR